MDLPPPPTDPPCDDPPPTGGPPRDTDPSGWAVSLERVRALAAEPTLAGRDEVAVLAGEHRVARFLLAELTEERDELEALGDHLDHERRHAARALTAAVDLLSHLTGEDTDTILLAVGARPEWLPDHPGDEGCSACGPGAAPF